jgi:hypothetical protein
MKIFLIRLKNFPELYVGKKNTSYAISSDEHLNRGSDTAEEAITHNGNIPHWFASKDKAKIWTKPTPIIWLRSYASDKDEDTFSQYIVEIDDNGTITEVPLDNFNKSFA